MVSGALYHGGGLHWSRIVQYESPDKQRERSHTGMILKCHAQTCCRYCIAIDRLIKAPQSPPCVTKRPYPSTSTMRFLNARAVRTGPKPDLAGASPGPTPGMLGFLKWKAGLEGLSGCVRGLVLFLLSRNEPRQPWAMRRGIASGLGER